MSVLSYVSRVLKNNSKCQILTQKVDFHTFNNEGGVESAVGNVGLKNSLHIFIRDIAEKQVSRF